MLSQIIKDLNLNDPDYIRSNKDELINVCKEGIENGKFKLCDIVEGLQYPLTHTNVDERCLGTLFLVDILKSLSPHVLTGSELKFLSAFCVDRLKDHHSIVPQVLIGFNVLVRHNNIGSDDVKILLQGLFKEVHCQSQIMTDRRNIFNFLKYCILYKSEEVKQLGTSFLLGFISMMEGEKDPRNLLLLFSIIPALVSEVPLGAFAEDLFEVVSAYFPIDFVPPLHDPYGIVPEDLISTLRKALSSSEGFAPYLIPLVVEKLESDVQSAKLESLRTLQACCESFSSNAMRPHATILWDAVRSEIVGGASDETVEQEALDALSGLIRALERPPVPPDPSDILQLGFSAMMECLPHLSTPEQKMMFPSSRLLLALCSPSANLSREVCLKVLPLLCDQYQAKSEISARKNTLIVLAKFLALGNMHNLYDKEPFPSLVSKCFDIFFNTLSPEEDKSICETGLHSLSMNARSIPSSMGHLISSALTNLLNSEKFSKNLKLPLSECIGDLSRENEVLRLNYIVPALVKIHDDAARCEENAGISILMKVSEVVCQELAAFEVIFPVLWEKVERDFDDPVVLSYLKLIETVVQHGAKNNDSIMKFVCGFHVGLTVKCVHLYLKIMGSHSSDCNILILKQIAAICRWTSQWENDAFILYLGNLLLGVASRTKATTTTLPYENDMDMIAKQYQSIKPIHRPLCIFLLHGLLFGASVTQFESPRETLAILKSWSDDDENEKVRECSSALYACFLLGVDSEELLENLLSPLEEEYSISSSESFTKTLPSMSSRKILFFGWILKALIMRSFAKDSDWINRMDSFLKTEEWGSDACVCYQFLLKDCDELNTSCGSFKLFYRQRFFERRVGPLVDCFKSSDGKTKMNCLLAISGLLPHIPKQILKKHLTKLLPVFCYGLTLGQESVSRGAVSSLSSIVDADAEGVKPHLSGLIPPLLAASVNAHIETRVNSLVCLEKLAKLTPVLIMPYKKKVLQDLKPALNDRKRVVRQAAVNARCLWILL